MVDVVDMVPERSEPNSFVGLSFLPYALLCTLQVCGAATGACRCLLLRFPVLCPTTAVHTFSISDAVFRTCFTAPHSLRPVSLPSTFSADPGAPWSLFDGFFGTMELSDFPQSCIAVVLQRIHGTDHYAIHNGQLRDIPVPVRETCMRAQGLRPRGVGMPLAIARHAVLPSAALDGVGTPEEGLFAAQYLAHMPPVNASQNSLQSTAHDSGPMRFATPSSYGTFTHYLSPVFTGAPGADPSAFL